MLKGLPGGASPEELHDLLEPLSDEERASWSTRLAALTRQEAAEYRQAVSRLKQGTGLPRVLLYPIKHRTTTTALARFVALVLVGESGPKPSLWVVSGYLTRTSNGSEIAIGALMVQPMPESPETVIGSTVLRVVAKECSAILGRAQALLLDEPEWLDVLEHFDLVVPTSEEKQRARALAEAAAGLTLRRGRTGYPDDHYRRIALRYLDLQREGIGRGINKRIAELETKHLGRHVARETARDWISGATKRGFLAPGKQGRAGREPGPNLYRPNEQDGSTP